MLFSYASDLYEYSCRLGQTASCSVHLKGAEYQEVEEMYLLMVNMTSRISWLVEVILSDLITLYFTDETMTNNDPSRGAGHPFYYESARITTPSGGSVPKSDEFVPMLHGGKAFILGCSTTIYVIQYDHVNGSITRFVPTPSNTPTSNIWQSIVSKIPGVTNTVDQAVLAGSSSRSAQEFVDQVALAYSKVVLAGGAESLEKWPALAVQTRITPLVTRIPAAPLITLVVVDLLYVVCGFVSAAVAIISARG